MLHRRSNMPAAAIGFSKSTWPWIPTLGIRFQLGLDGLSLWMVLLAGVLGIFSIVASWGEIKHRVGFFHFNLLLMLAGIIGVFTALDLFLFYFFWELMLIPTFFLIFIWGDANRRVAGLKFFIFTQLSGLLMLVAIIGLFFVHGRNTGEYTFAYSKLLETAIDNSVARWLMLGFLAAFLVKLPAVPFHTWLPPAYTSAPTAASILLAGLMSKTAGYALIRFAIPLFDDVAADFAWVAMLLGVITILYGAVLAFAQTDLKRLIAYSSISHLGFVLLGVFAWNELALQGAVMQMICHGLSVGALFLLAGLLEKRLHTRDMEQMGGLWSVVPRMGGVTLFFALASLGLPGLGNFVGEFLVLLGTFKVQPTLAAVAAVGMVASVIYSLWMIQLIFHGPEKQRKLADLNFTEMSALGALAVALVWLGLYPLPVLNSVGSALPAIQEAGKQRANSGLLTNQVRAVEFNGQAPVEFTIFNSHTIKEKR